MKTLVESGSNQIKEHQRQGESERLHPTDKHQGRPSREQQGSRTRTRRPLQMDLLLAPYDTWRDDSQVAASKPWR